MGRFPKHFRGGRGLTRKPGVLNGTEQERADQLEAARRAGEVLAWWFSPLRMRLAGDNAFYTPDFMVLYPDGAIVIEEVKGFWEEAALVRIKVAADRYPFAFRALTKRPKKLGGGWDVREFKGWGEDSNPAVTPEAPSLFPEDHR